MLCASSLFDFSVKHFEIYYPDKELFIEKINSRVGDLEITVSGHRSLVGAEGAASKGWLDMHGDNWSKVGYSLHRQEWGGGVKYVIIFKI